MNSAATVALGWPTSFCLPNHVNQIHKCGEEQLPEQKLSVQVTDINSIHVDYMNIFKSRQRQIGQDLTSETTSADDQDLGLIS